jgi:YfiH family protein
MSDAFEWRQAVAGAALVCRPLEQVARHVFTTREWPLGSASAAGDLSSWNDVARAMDVESDGLLRVHQVHGASVVIQRAGQPMVAHADADILASDDPTVALSIQTADCVPLLVADSRTGAVAAAHAGWRGLAERVPLATVEAMGRAFGSQPPNLVVAIGPAIGPCCYEVGRNVRDRFAAEGFSDSELARWLTTEARSSATNPSMDGMRHGARDGRWFFDMWTAARDQLRSAGVREDRIFLAELCTASHAAAFCSYRREGSAAGRMAAAIRTRNRYPP